MTVTEFLRMARRAKMYCEARHLNPNKIEIGFQVQRPRELEWQGLDHEDFQLITIGAKNADEELTVPGGVFVGLSIAEIECNADSGAFTAEELQDADLRGQA